MPWTTKSDVAKHNKKAAENPTLRRLWKSVANGHLKNHPDDDAGAITRANGVVKKRIHESDLNEQRLDEIGLGDFGRNVYYSTLGALGDKTAIGRNEDAKAVNALIDDYYKFLGQFRIKQPTLSSIMAFLDHYYGKELSLHVGNQFLQQKYAGSQNQGQSQEQEQPQAAQSKNSDVLRWEKLGLLDPSPAAKPQQAAPQAAQSQNTAKPAPKPRVIDPANQVKVDQEKEFIANRANNIVAAPKLDKYVAKYGPDKGPKMHAVAMQLYNKKRKQAGNPNKATNFNAYQQNTFGQLGKLVAGDINKQTIPQILSLANEISKHAKDYGGNDRNRVKAYFDRLKSSPNVRNNPTLANAINNMKLEHINFAIGLASYLFENNLSGKQALAEAMVHLLEWPFRPSTAKVKARLNQYRPAPNPGPTAGSADPAPQSNPKPAGQQPNPANKPAANSRPDPFHIDPQGAAASKPTTKIDPNMVLSKQDIKLMFRIAKDQLFLANRITYNDPRHNDQEVFIRNPSGRYYSLGNLGELLANEIDPKQENEEIYVQAANGRYRSLGRLGKLAGKQHYVKYKNEQSTERKEPRIYPKTKKPEATPADQVDALAGSVLNMRNRHDRVIGQQIVNFIKKNKIGTDLKQIRAQFKDIPDTVLDAIMAAKYGQVNH